MFTVAFYSFRGGVGRTMAVANVAYQLAVKRQDVFIVDFDLEAPGLSFMPDFQPRGKGPKSPIGLAGFLAAGINGKPIPQVKDLSYVPKIARGKEVRGRIHVLPSGDLARGGRAYDVSDLHLEQLYADKQRAVVIDDLREQIADEFKPDYLLVDSRTGLTELAGICTTHLAEFVVILFGLNQQNLDGTALVLQRLRKANSDIGGRCLLVASPVPVGEEQLKAKRLEAARKALAAALEVKPEAMPDILTIPYHPQLALTEDSFVAHHPDSHLSSAYKSITGAVRARNAQDLGFRFEQAVEHVDRDPVRAWEILEEVCRSPKAPPEALGLYAALLDTTGRGDEAEEYFRRSIQAAPRDAGYLGNYALFLKRRERFSEAEEWYRKALDADPGSARALGDYGWLLYERRGDAAEALGFTERALAVDPKRVMAGLNRGLFLLLLGRAEESRRQYEATLSTQRVREKDIRDGLADLRGAAAKRPGDEAIAETLAWFEAQVGRSG